MNYHLKKIQKELGCENCKFCNEELRKKSEPCCEIPQGIRVMNKKGKTCTERKEENENNQKK